MALPVVTIIGRTNVGKSTLFNRITKSRRAIVADEPGVTRDRLFGTAAWRTRPFLLVDTGGFENPHGEYIKERMLEQTRTGIEEADRVLFMVDARAGLLPADRDVALELRKSGKPIFLVVNKVDVQRGIEERLAEFYALGLDAVFPVSAEHGEGMDTLLDAVTDGFEEVPEEPDEEDEGHPTIEEAAEAMDARAVEAEARPLRIAIVGRPNVGKSSLVNMLLGYERMVVHDQAGTTRDAIDTLLEWEGRKFVLVDTAGVRRKSRISERVEKFSVVKAFRAIEECDVGVLVLDATLGPEDQDARIAGMIVEEGRGLVVVFNKWDLPEGREQRIKELQDLLRRQMKFLPDPPVVFVSAKTGQRVPKILELAEQVGLENSKRIPTSKFNEMLLAATEHHKPPMYANQNVKFYYAAQIGVRPPTFALKTNLPQGVHFSYQRFIENWIRDRYGFQGAPIRLKFRKR